MEGHEGLHVFCHPVALQPERRVVVRVGSFDGSADLRLARVGFRGARVRRRPESPIERSTRRRICARGCAAAAVQP
eukprot:3681281-Pleurochrysis_carterae.AAC.1